MFRHSLRYTAFAQICLTIFLLAGRAFAQAPNDAGTGPKEGDKCKVTAGTNKVKLSITQTAQSIARARGGHGVRQ